MLRPHGHPRRRQGVARALAQGVSKDALMELQHVNVKLYVENPEGTDLEVLIPVFHNWIQDQVCEELLIDVADYRHVHQGPGVILIGHEANYSLDNTDNRLGVRYNRKAPLAGSNQDRFTQATRAALTAYRRLDSDPRIQGKFLLNGQELELFVNDRLLAPNLEKTYQAAKPELESFFGKLFAGSGYSVAHNGDPRNLFSVEVQASRPFTASELLKNLS